MEKGMANKEKIDYLLLDIRELETLVAGMRDAEVYPVSFFGQTSPERTVPSKVKFIFSN